MHYKGFCPTGKGCTVELAHLILDLRRASKAAPGSKRLPVQGDVHPAAGWMQTLVVGGEGLLVGLVAAQRHPPLEHGIERSGLRRKR